MSSLKSRGRPRRFTRDEARELRRRIKAGELTVSAASSELGVGTITINKVVKGVGAYANTL